MSGYRTLRSGVFLPPFHPNEDPLLCMERDFQLMQWFHVHNYAEGWIGEHHLRRVRDLRPTRIVHRHSSPAHPVHPAGHWGNLATLPPDLPSTHGLRRMGSCDAQGREGQLAYGDITQAPVGDRTGPRHAFGAPEYLAYVVLNGGHA